MVDGTAAPLARMANSAPARHLAWSALGRSLLSVVASGHPDVTDRGSDPSSAVIVTDHVSIGQHAHFPNHESLLQPFYVFTSVVLPGHISQQSGLP
jgi:hypothetical protein